MSFRFKMATTALLMIASAGQARSELSLSDALRAAVQASPRVSAGRARAAAAESATGAARSSYYPQVDLYATESTGFPGSTRGLSLDGLVGSPYRSGAAAGVSARMTLVDFGRASASVEGRDHEALGEK